MPLDEATSQLVAQMAAAGAPALHQLDPAAARAILKGMAAAMPPGPDVARSEDHCVTSSGGAEIPVRVLVPHDRPRGVIVHYHGGGWVIGDVDDSDALARTLAVATGCAVVVVGYRLAPEHPYPAAVDDARVALEWTASKLQTIARADVPLLVFGESAGGTLAAVAAQHAAAKGIRLALQVLLYPVMAADFTTASYLDPENQVMLGRESMEWFWDHYAPDPSRRREPDASPLLRDDVRGLAPALVITAEHDVLRDEGEAYVDKLLAAGVTVEHTRYLGQIHSFFGMPMLPAAATALQQITAAIDGALARVG